MSFFKEFWITGSAHILHLIVSFFNTIIVTRYLGPEGRGKYTVVTNFIVFLSLIFGEGIRRKNTILVGKNREYLTKLILQTFSTGLLITFFFSLVFFTKECWHFLIPNISAGIFAIALLTSLFSILWQAIQALHLGLKNILDFNVLQVLSVAVVLIVNLTGIYLLNFTLTEILGSILFGSLITFFFGIYGFRKNLNFGKAVHSFESTGISIIVKSTVSALLILIILKGDLFLINFYLGAEQTGIYSVPVIFSDLVQKIPTVLGLLVISRTVNDNLGDNLLNTAKIVRVIFFVNILISLTLLILGKEIILLLFSVKFVESYKVLIYLIPAFIFFGPGAVIYSYFIGRAFPKQVIIINCLIAIFNIGLNIIFIPVYGIKASALISSSTYFIWTLIYLVYYKKSSRLLYKDLLIIKNEDIRYLFLSVKKMISPRN